MRLNKRLFLYFFSIFFILMIVIGFFQYQREKAFRTDQLDQVLATYNYSIYNFIEKNSLDYESLMTFLKVFPDTDLRVSVIDVSGEVLFDSYVAEVDKLENHIDRPEIQLASADSREGVAIRRSSTTGIDFYYLAQRFDAFYVRSALPYNVNLTEMLSANLYFLYFMVFILLIASFLLFFISKNITRSIDRLQLFLHHAENDQLVNTEIKFPKDELGQISSSIVNTYKNLWKTKSQVKREREKLIQHLQLSQEGLGIFSSEKKEILVNSHFVLYAKILSDKVLDKVDEVFKIPEFSEINLFINESLQNHQLIRKRLILEKGGRVFLIQCIVFKDDTFEISINDITVEEQKNRLKKQLTQNISHELKTPVSSILGYMESIINNPKLAPERHQFFVKRSYMQALRLAALLQDISTLNKMDESGDIFGMEQVDIRQVVLDVLQDVQLQLEDKNTFVNNRLFHSLPVRGNRSLLYSIFRNLTDNVLAHAGEEVEIEISCYREDQSYYYFLFADTGPGISEEHVNRIFERFYRVDKGRSRKMGGTGLGLAIVKNAVIYHGGDISVKNVYPQGLHFIFSIKK